MPQRLGDPQEVRLDGDVVTLVYGDGDLLVAQLPGALDEQLLTKVVGPGTDVRRLPDGLFFSGRDHAYLYRRPDGGVAEDARGWRATTFVTERGDVLLRLEAPRLTPERSQRRWPAGPPTPDQGEFWEDPRRQAGHGATDAAAHALVTPLEARPRGARSRPSPSRPPRPPR